MLGRRGPKQPMLPVIYTFTCKTILEAKDSTFVEERCELLVLQSCPARAEDDAVPAILFSGRCCCNASQMGSLSS